MLSDISISQCIIPANGSTHLFIRNNLLVKLVDMDLFLAMCRLEDFEEVAQKLPAKVLDMAPRVLADQQDLSDVAFALDVAVGYQQRSPSVRREASV